VISDIEILLAALTHAGIEALQHLKDAIGKRSY
jgi:hypothetical protein